jgi:predicted DNA-binding transcriptional regulator YafY
VTRLWRFKWRLWPWPRFGAAGFFTALERLSIQFNNDENVLQHLLTDLSHGFAVLPQGRAATDQQEVVANLTKAWRLRQVCLIDVDQLNSTRTTRRVQPYGLVLRGDHLLLIARLCGVRRRELRHFRVDRIAKARTG